MYACRTCQYSQPAASPCVFRHDLSNTVGETAGVTQDVGADPTVGLPDFCTLCGQKLSCEVCGMSSSGGSSCTEDREGEADRSLWMDDPGPIEQQSDPIQAA